MSQGKEKLSDLVLTHRQTPHPALPDDSKQQSSIIIIIDRHIWANRAEKRDICVLPPPPALAEAAGQELPFPSVPPLGIAFHRTELGERRRQKCRSQQHAGRSSPKLMAIERNQTNVAIKQPRVFIERTERLAVIVELGAGLVSSLWSVAVEPLVVSILLS